MQIEFNVSFKYLESEYLLLKIQILSITVKKACLCNKM